jgi:hypothetical protein
MKHDNSQTKKHPKVMPSGTAGRYLLIELGIMPDVEGELFSKRHLDYYIDEITRSNATPYAPIEVEDDRWDEWVAENGVSEEEYQDSLMTREEAEAQD